MTPGEAQDRVAIADLLARYNMHGDRFHVDALAALFGDTGTLRFSGAASIGQAAIAARLGEPGARNPALTLSRHHLTTSTITLNADLAGGRTYFQVLTDIGLDHHGVYVDMLQKRDGGWWFTSRDVRIDWQSQASLYPRLHVRGIAPA